MVQGKKTFEEVHSDWANYQIDVENVLKEFIANEAELCSAGFERPATARLGLYFLRKFGKKWDVDCEYDRSGLDPKEYHIPIQVEGERLTLSAFYKKYVNPKASPYEIETKIARPDVIIHHRRMPAYEHNLLMIEAKIASGPNRFDKGKLLAFTQGVRTKSGDILRYQYGLCLCIPELNKDAKHLTSKITAHVFTHDFEPRKLTITFEVNNAGLDKDWRK